MKDRIYRFDNAKCLLIFLVVLGHFLIYAPDPLCQWIGRVFYLFHMPAFLFVSGFFASYDPRKNFKSLIVPYIVFQFFSTLFYCLVTRPGADFGFTLTTPRFALWYTLVLFYYCISIPFFDTDRIQSQAGFLIGSILFSLCVGYDPHVGRYMSLSRAFTFAPYFLAGFYLRKDLSRIPAALKAKSRILVLLGVLLSLAGIVVIYLKNISLEVLYGSYSYSDLAYTPLLRLFITLVGFGGIFCMLLIPNKRLPLLSRIGSNTKPVYFLHLFVVLYLKKIQFFHYSPVVNLGLAVLLSVVLVLLLSSTPVAQGFRYLFNGAFLSGKSQKP